jgi:hypothetical protein
MTAEAPLEFKVPLPRMALGALRDLAVDGMTGGTVQGAVLARMFFQQGILPCVTGETNAFFGQRHIQRRMRIAVAAEAIFMLEVDFPSLAVMAFAAGFDRLFDLRRMTDVAAYTGDDFMSPSRSLYILCRAGMALFTFFSLERFYLGRGHGGISGKGRDPRYEKQYDTQPPAFYRFHPFPPWMIVKCAWETYKYTLSPERGRNPRNADETDILKIMP